MKAESVKKMLAAEYKWNEDHFSVRFDNTYLGDMKYSVVHLDGTELSVAVRVLETTPIDFDA